MESVFDWLPKPGEKKDIPGGFIFCESWTLNRSGKDNWEGEVVFKFYLTDQGYLAMQNREIEAKKQLKG